MESQLNAKSLKQTLAPAGKLRAAINVGNSVLAQSLPDGTLSGVSVVIASALAQVFDVELTLVRFNHAREAFHAVVNRDVDLAFVAIDQDRAENVAYSKPYLELEATYLVRSESGFSACGELDRADCKIASATGSAFGLYLDRTLRFAQTVHYESAQEAKEALVRNEVLAAAGIRQMLSPLAFRSDAVRLLDDNFMSVRQAVCVPPSQAAVLEPLNNVLAKLTASGELEAALEASGQMAKLLRYDL